MGLLDDGYMDPMGNQAYGPAGDAPGARPDPSLTGYNPTWRDRAAAWMMGDGRASPERRRFVEGLLGSSGLGSTGMGLVDATPIGMAMSANEAKHSYDEGDYTGAAFNAVGALPLPGAKAGKVVKGAAMLEDAGRAGGMNRTVRKVSAEALDTKKLSGAPLGVSTPQKEQALREAYKQRVIEGKAGAPWYDESGNAIHYHTGENVDLSNKVSEAYATTSASTGVNANGQFAIKGHNQAVLGAPVKAGRFPEAMSKQIEEVYHGGGTTSGKKRTPFADQLATGGGYYVKPDGQAHRAVHDIWDGEAWQYVNPDGTPLRRAFTDAEHNWMDKQMDRVITDLNKTGGGGRTDWTPGRGQAASWTGAKIRAGNIKPEDAAYSYADHLPTTYMQGSRESVPGSNTGHMQGLLTAPLDVRNAYHDEVNRIIYDEKGRDRIALGNNMLTGQKFDGPGVYEGINPGTQAQYATGSEAIALNPATGDQVPLGSMLERMNKKTGKMETGKAPETRAIDPASRKLAEATEAQYGLLTGQKAIAGSRMFDGPVALQNGMEIPLGRTLTNDQAERLMRMPGFDPNKMAVVPTPTGFRIADFGLGDEGMRDFAARASKELGGGKPVGRRFDGIYGENNWDQNRGRVGQEYLGMIRDKDYPVLAQNFDATAPKLAGQLADLDARFSKQYGFEVSPLIQDMRRAIAADGAAGIDMLVKRLGLGAAAVAPLLAAAGQLGLLQQQDQKEMPRGLL